MILWLQYIIYHNMIWWYTQYIHLLLQQAQSIRPCLVPPCSTHWTGKLRTSCYLWSETSSCVTWSAPPGDGWVPPLVEPWENPWEIMEDWFSRENLRPETHGFLPSNIRNIGVSCKCSHHPISSNSMRWAYPWVSYNNQPDGKFHEVCFASSYYGHGCQSGYTA